jgi:hypothetical protein
VSEAEAGSPVPRRSVGCDVAVFFASVLIVLVPTVSLLWSHDGDPSALLRIGDRSASRSYVERDLPDPVLTSGFGHDGQQFYVVARAFPDLQSADGHVDRLRYRARRVLYPALVAPFPAGEPTVWAMLAVNAVAVGAAGIAMSRLATKVRAPWWLGVTVALSPALLVSTRASLADALAFALALWGVVLWRRHLWWAVALFVLAALARETSLVVPLACLLVGSRPRERLAMLVPFAAYGAWTLTVSAWLDPSDAGSSSPFGDATRQLAMPFEAFAQLGWSSRGVLLGVALFAGSLLAAWQLRRLLPEIAIWLVADAILLVTAAIGVAEDTLNLTRLTPLAVPAIALAIALRVAPTAHAAPSGAAERGPRTGSVRADLVP